MKYIKINRNENGSHNNQFGGAFPGEGWAIIPEEMTIPSSFPFVDIEVLENIVVSMKEKEVPFYEPSITLTEIILSTLVDQEERICLLELGC